MGIYMFALGTSYIIMGIILGKDVDIVIGNIWLVGTIIIGEIKNK